MANSYRNPSSTYGVTSDQPYSISGQQPTSSNLKLQKTQQEVDQVTNIMRENMAKAMERESKLNEMDERAIELQVGAEQFQTTAKKVQRKFWWKNIKMWIILIAVLVVLAIIIGVAIYFSTKDNSSSSSNVKTNNNITPKA